MEQTDSAFVEQVFHLVLRRTPDEDGLTSALERLEAGTLSRAGLHSRCGRAPRTSGRATCAGRRAATSA